MKDERLESALLWCEKHNLDPTRLTKFNLESKKKPVKGNLDKKEFEEMCKKAGVERRSLCETIFTKDL